jgi:hypothetical protein
MLNSSFLNNFSFISSLGVAGTTVAVQTMPAKSIRPEAPGAGSTIAETNGEGAGPDHEDQPDQLMVQVNKNKVRTTIVKRNNQRQLKKESRNWWPRL